MEVKLFIVESLACFDTPSEVERAVREQFGIVMTRQAVDAYDASKAYSRKNMSAELIEHFESARKEFLTNAEGIPIANKQYRLRLLQKTAERAMTKGNLVLAMQAAEQAAKETGGSYEGRLKIEQTGKGGGPIQVETMAPDLSKLSLQELQALRPIAEKLHAPDAKAD
jgi:hypothetical protein